MPTAAISKRTLEPEPAAKPSKRFLEPEQSAVYPKSSVVATSARKYGPSSMPAAVPGAGTGCSEPGLVRKEINRKFIKIRRGRRRQKNVKRLYSSDLNILHCNIRGYDSKQVSLQSILSASKPNLVILNETHYVSRKQRN